MQFQFTLIASSSSDTVQPLVARFLSELGKGQYAAIAGRIVRRWQILNPSPELFTILNRDRQAAVANPSANLNWTPAYSLVNGDLPLNAGPAILANKNAWSGSMHSS